MSGRGENARSFAPHTAVLGLLLAVLVISGIYPLQRLVADRNRVTALRARSADLDRKTDELRARREALQTDPEVERIARADLGMVRRGERAFALVPSASPAAAAPKPAASKTQQRDETGPLGRWWEAFARAFTLSRGPSTT